MAQLHCNRRWPLQEDRICLHPHRMRCDGHVALLLHQDTGGYYLGDDLMSIPDARHTPLHWRGRPSGGAIQVEHVLTMPGTARLDMHD